MKRYTPGHAYFVSITHKPFEGEHDPWNENCPCCPAVAYHDYPPPEDKEEAPRSFPKGLEDLIN